MICAGLGLLIAFIPFLFWLAAILGLTAIGLGIAGIVRAGNTSPAQGKGLAIAGTSVGGLAVVAAFISFFVWTSIVNDMFDEFAEELSDPTYIAAPSDYEASITSCESIGSEVTASGTITNTSSFSTGFNINVVFEDSDGLYEGNGYDTVFDLGPGETGSFTVTSTVASEHVDCKVTVVYSS